MDMYLAIMRFSGTSNIDIPLEILFDDEKGIKFALSNVLQKKKLNVRNEILYNWLERNNNRYFHLITVPDISVPIKYGINLIKGNSPCSLSSG